jgi:NAD-dependent SIR2 family protein deacetylase
MSPCINLLHFCVFSIQHNDVVIFRSNSLLTPYLCHTHTRAGVNPELLVQAHGTFSSAKCIDCKRDQDPVAVKANIMAGVCPWCECGGTVKPDIVFFGEALPQRFFATLRDDMRNCDLLIVMGTSLQVRITFFLLSYLHENCNKSPILFWFQCFAKINQNLLIQAY